MRILLFMCDVVGWLPFMGRGRVSAKINIPKLIIEDVQHQEKRAELATRKCCKFI